MKLKNLNLKIGMSSFGGHFFLRMSLFFLLINSVWLIRFPFVFSKLYAEDGNFLLEDAKKYRFPEEFFRNESGYSLLSDRIGGRFVSLFPLSYAPFACALFAALCLSFLAAGIFKFNNLSSNNFGTRFCLSLCFIFLPLSSFSAVGNVANLYVYFMTASAVFLFYKEKTKSEFLYKSLVLFIAALSLPLTVFLLPILIHRSYLESKVIGFWKIQKSDFVFLLGLLLQLIFIVTTSLGNREPHAPQSLFKVIYLYLDRGIGISMIPRWGFISGSNSNPSYENSLAIFHSISIRLLAVLFLLISIGLLYLQTRSSLAMSLRSQFVVIVLLGFIYSTLVGLFFNPEPRYMIFTSFLTCWVALLLLDSQHSVNLRNASIAYMLLVLLMGLTSSNHRSQGPLWNIELAKAKHICLQANPESQIGIRTLPIDKVWEITLPCKKLN